MFMRNINSLTGKAIVFVLIIVAVSACTTSSNLIETSEESVSENPALLGLYEQAQASLDAGDTEAARAKIERALRIESDNPYLWLQLAQIGFIEEDYPVAREMAKRARNFAVGQPALAEKIEDFINQLATYNARTAEVE